MASHDFGGSKRRLTLAGALRWNGDSYRAGHWPWTTENFFFSFHFFTLCLNPEAWFHLVEKVSQLELWNSVHECVNQCKYIWAKAIFSPIGSYFKDHDSNISVLQFLKVSGKTRTHWASWKWCAREACKWWHQSEQQRVQPILIIHDNRMDVFPLNPSTTQQKAHVYIWKPVEAVRAQSEHCQTQAPPSYTRGGSCFFFFFYLVLVFDFFRSKQSQWTPPWCRVEN